MQFPQIDSLKSFDLVGIEGRDLGGAVIDFWDIFDFEIGDVFVHKHGYGSNKQWYTDVEKRKILSKTISNDSILYEVEVYSFFVFHDNPWGGNDTSRAGSIYTDWIFKNTNPIPNRYPNELIFLEDPLFGASKLVRL